jgi:hypothetical protein
MVTKSTKVEPLLIFSITLVTLTVRQVGFLVWSLVLCLVVRFLGVYLLTFIVNQFRIKPINLQASIFLSSLKN